MPPRKLSPELVVVGAVLLLAIGAALVFLPAWGNGGQIPPTPSPGTPGLPSGGDAFSCAPGDRVLLGPFEQEVDVARVHGDWVVWNALVEGAGTDADVYAYHLPTRALRALATGPDIQSMPYVDAGHAVWREERIQDPSRPYVVMAMELASGTIEEVPLPFTGFLAVRGLHDGLLLVRVELDDAAEDGLYTYALGNGTLTRVANASALRSDIGDGGIVWAVDAEASPTGRGQLVHHDPATGVTRVLNEGIGHLDPSIDGDRVVYATLTAADREDLDVHVLDRSTGETRVVPSPFLDRDQDRPHVTGDWVTHLDVPEFGPIRLSAYNLATAERVELAKDVGVRSDAWNGRVVYTEIERSVGAFNAFLFCLA